MSEYTVCYENKELMTTITASSYDEAFVNAVGDYAYKEVDEDDFYDIIITGEYGPRYYRVRFG